MDNEVGTRSVYESMGGGGPSVAGGLPLFAAMVTEAELTFMLVLVVLMSTARERDNTLAPMAIGLTLVACTIAGYVYNSLNTIIRICASLFCFM